ncbi:MAG: hypothetical protein ACRDFX_09280 [Chloroflexota bacterium]
MRIVTIRSALLALTIVLAAVAALGAHAMATHSAAASKGNSLGQGPGAGAYWLHGQFHDPPAIASRVSSLNDALGACLTSHGAPRVNLAGGGWTYRDPHGTAAASCQVQADAVNAFSNGPKMAASDQATRPLLDAFWSCMVSRGLSPANPNADNHSVQINTQSNAFKTGSDACSAAANGAFGVTVP